MAEADSACVRKSGTRWTMGTGAVERVVSLEDGRFLLKSFRDKRTGRELLPLGAEPAELAATVGGQRITGATGGWTFVSSKTSRLKQGEARLDVVLRHGALQAAKTYVLYPGSSIIREWVTYSNAASEPLQVVEPAFLAATVRVGRPNPPITGGTFGRSGALPLDGSDVSDKSDPSDRSGSAPVSTGSPRYRGAGGATPSPIFCWMTGGENQPGSWVLKTEGLEVGKPRKFDSYDPFPLAPDKAGYRGDGVDAGILANGRQIWPESGWQYVANANVTVPFDLRVNLAAGDRLQFVVNKHGNIGWDTTSFDPTIAYADGEKHTASAEFSDKQGEHGWRYGYLRGGRFEPLFYHADKQQWRREKDNAYGTPFVGAANQHPDEGMDAAREWTAPRAGEVHITGSVCNTGNQGGPGAYGFHMGNSVYAPWTSIQDPESRQGLFIGWDYFGHWASAYTRNPDDSVSVEMRVAGHKKTLKPGESLTTPAAFIGLFSGDLDNAGNELLDWQYRYLWDYTREPWFPALRMLGYWYKGTGWGLSGVGWTGGGPDYGSTFRKVFRMADLLSRVGADVYHRDWGWWDRAGDWNGPDFRATGDYLHKHGMGQLIYAFLYTVDKDSQVAREHPDWVLGGNTLDMSRPEVVEFMKGQLDSFYEKWGAFEWRNDSTPTAPDHGDDTPLLGQDHGLREVLRGFLDKHPDCAFQAVNGGGNNASYDYIRYSSTIQFSDGAVGPIRNYWASLLFPPDKTNDMPDIYDPDKFDKATWRGLLCCNFDTTGDTIDEAKLEGLRELNDIYHYLFAQGVVGRWVKVYRPLVEGDDPTMYLQRMSGDGKRGIIIPKHPAPGLITIRLKGLIPSETYTVTYQESGEQQRRTGDDLMATGIRLEKMAPGELIYLNLPFHPGNRLDKTPPSPPSQVTVRPAVNMGYPGVEVTWSPGRDDHWVSCYDVYRNDAKIDRVAKGTYYFDHSADADSAATYAVQTVDGAGNVSTKAAGRGTVAQPALVIDDAPGGGMAFSGEWKRLTGIRPAHGGTLTVSGRKGDSAEVPFTGRRVLLFVKLGADCGKAAVSIDGGPAEAVDTYSADDIWGICAFRKDVSPGEHTLRLEVLGEKSARSSGTLVHVDGIRAEP